MSKWYYIPKKNIQKGFLVTDFLSINMPDVSEDNMVLSGIHYNLDFCYLNLI